MKLSIIIVNYNTGQLTASCVKNILQKKLPVSYEIIVVDNGSDDDSVSLLKSDYPEIQVIANEQNLGLARAVNIGIEQAGGQYILVLNPDIVVIDDAIEKLIDYMEQNPDVGVAGGKLLSPNGKLQYSSYRFYKPMTILYRRTGLGNTKKGKQAVSRFLMKDYDHSQITDVDWLMGACLLIRTKALKQVGGMDERFFLYFEDVDWCRRFWEKGWRVVYMPKAHFSHYHQQSSRTNGLWGLLTNWVVREHIRSAVKYFWKYHGKPWPHISK